MERAFDDMKINGAICSNLDPVCDWWIAYGGFSRSRRSLYGWAQEEMVDAPWDI